MPASSSQPAMPGAPAPQAIEIVASGQNSITMSAGQAYAIILPASVPGHHPPPRTWRLKNLGPADIWARWDGLGDAAVNDPASVVLDQGEIIPGFITTRLSMVCSSQPGGGARVSFTVA